MLPASYIEDGSAPVMAKLISVHCGRHHNHLCVCLEALAGMGFEWATLRGVWVAALVLTAALTTPKRISVATVLS